jgi:hypothetical protein
MPVMYYTFPPYIRGGLQIEIEGQSFLITYLTLTYCDCILALAFSDFMKSLYSFQN